LANLLFDTELLVKHAFTLASVLGTDIIIVIILKLVMSSVIGSVMTCHKFTTNLSVTYGCQHIKSCMHLMVLILWEY